MTAVVDDLRRRLAEACCVLGTLGLASGATGHISARVPGSENILIRARGPAETGVRYTTPAEIIEVTPDGAIMPAGNADLLPPQEVHIHTEIYRVRRDVDAVVHVHPPTVVLFTVAGVPLLPIFGAFDPSALKIAMDGVPIYPRSVLVNTPDLGRDLAKALGDSNLCMMHGHGITTVGSSVEEAALRAISLNDLAEMNYRARLLGDARPIPDDDLSVFARLFREPPKRILSNQQMTMWQYYMRVTGIT